MHRTATYINPRAPRRSTTSHHHDCDFTCKCFKPPRRSAPPPAAPAFVYYLRGSLKRNQVYKRKLISYNSFHKYFINKFCTNTKIIMLLENSSLFYLLVIITAFNLNINIYTDSSATHTCAYAAVAGAETYRISPIKCRVKLYWGNVISVQFCILAYSYGLSGIR